MFGFQTHLLERYDIGLVCHHKKQLHPIVLSLHYRGVVSILRVLHGQLSLVIASKVKQWRSEGKALDFSIFTDVVSDLVDLSHDGAHFAAFVSPN